ncbi:NAD-dependent epimerase/dehydratase family protein [Bacillus infantis]|uniref:NAD-dependent epimerase/dehydratase family protein n=1 Tax=Bacillus infantis TaxID=324767 RepID=UPI003CE7C51A
MSTLIIGAGLIGVHIAKEFRERGNKDYKILAHKVDFNYIQKISNTRENQVIEQAVSSSAQLIEIIKEFKVENIIIAAGSLHPHFKKHAGAAMLNESSLMLTIYAACSKVKVDKVVYISSLGVYGASSDRDEKSIPHPISPYGFTKLYNEQIFESLARETGTKVIVIRSTGTAGPNPEGSGNWMSTGLNNIFKVKDISTTTLSYESEYLDVRDLSSFIVDRLWDHDTPLLDVINLGPGYKVNVNELVAELGDIIGQSIKIPQVNNSSQDLVTLPIDKAKEQYHFSPKYNLKQTLRYISDYYDE